MKVYVVVGEQIYQVWTSETSEFSEVPEDEQLLCARCEIVDAIDEFLARNRAVLK